VDTPADSTSIRGRPAPGSGRRAWQAFRRLRPEEALFVAAWIPSTIVTIYANWSLQQSGGFSGKIASGILRLVVATLLALSIPLIERSRPRLTGRPGLLRGLDVFRTILPFLLCIAVYTNLHDTVRFVNPHDIHVSRLVRNVPVLNSLEMSPG